MKIAIGAKPNGSALLAAVFLGTILSMMLGSYMLLVRSQHNSVARSMIWNSCIPIAEAGVEEAITQIHYNGITNLSANGWVLANGVYKKQRYIGTSYYDVGITPLDPPTITSMGYVPLPGRETVIIAAVLPQGLTAPPVYLRRTVQVTTRRDGFFVKAMVAKGQIDFNGNNIKTDSFDSSDPAYSKSGRYDKTRAKNNGDVATNSGLVNSLNIGNANIYGHVATGPHGTIVIGSNGAVGDKNWQTGHAGIQPGWSNDDMNVSFPDIGIPYTTGSTPISGKVSGQTYKYVLGSTNYIMAELTLQSSDILYVDGAANLYVTDLINIAGSAQIELSSKGSLVLYMGGATAQFGGNQVVNPTGNAANFTYFGLPTNTSLRFVGNADFTGAIYAPSADFQLGGGGSSPYDFVGASVTSTVQLNGHFSFHYDEALGKSKWGRGYVIASWDEI